MRTLLQMRPPSRSGGSCLKMHAHAHAYSSRKPLQNDAVRMLRHANQFAWHDRRLLTIEQSLLVAILFSWWKQCTAMPPVQCTATMQCLLSLWHGLQAKLDDARFSAIFSNPAFALDPTDPRFGQSAGAQELATAVARRKQTQRSKCLAAAAAPSQEAPAPAAVNGKAGRPAGASAAPDPPSACCSSATGRPLRLCNASMAECAVIVFRSLCGQKRQQCLRHRCSSTVCVQCLS